MRHGAHQITILQPHKLSQAFILVHGIVVCHYTFPVQRGLTVGQSAGSVDSAIRLIFTGRRSSGPTDGSYKGIYLCGAFCRCLGELLDWACSCWHLFGGLDIWEVVL